MEERKAKTVLLPGEELDVPEREQILSSPGFIRHFVCDYESKQIKAGRAGVYLSSPAPQIVGLGGNHVRIKRSPHLVFSRRE